MTIIFNSNKLPHRNSKIPFGFVQALSQPTSISEYDDPIPKCSACKSKQFPLKSGKFACPICSPDSDYIEGSLKIRKGSKTKLLYFFAFDVQFSIDRTRCLLNQLHKAMTEDDTAVIICISTPYTIVSVDNGISYYTVIDDVTNFTASNTYELRKKDIIDSVLPSLAALYSIRTKKTPINIIPLVQVLIKQSEKRPFAAFCFLNSIIAPITAEKAAAASRSIALNKGIIHFGINEGFKRLTAISRMSMGAVFGISHILPTTIQRLIDLSQPAKMKIIMPRFIEVTKVTGSEGSMNMTAYVTKIILTSLNGCSARMNVDFSRVDDNHISSAKFIEITENSSGRFISIHSFGWSESADVFDSIALSKPLSTSTSIITQPDSSSHPPTLSPKPVNLDNTLNASSDTNNSNDSNIENQNQTNIYDFDQFSDKNSQFFDDSKKNLLITKNLILKGCASDVLRATWAGGDFAKHFDMLLNDPQVKDFVLSSCLADAVKAQERGVERFYYVLYSLLDDMTNKIIRVKKDHVLISPPIVFIYSVLDSPTDIIEKYIKNEWPFELRVLIDFDAFLLAAENQGFKLSENQQKDDH